MQLLAAAAWPNHANVDPVIGCDGTRRCSCQFRLLAVEDEVLEQLRGQHTERKTLKQTSAVHVFISPRIRQFGAVPVGNFGRPASGLVLCPKLIFENDQSGVLLPSFQQRERCLPAPI